MIKDNSKVKNLLSNIKLNGQELKEGLALQQHASGNDRLQPSRHQVRHQEGLWPSEGLYHLTPVSDSDERVVLQLEAGPSPAGGSHWRLKAHKARKRPGIEQTALLSQGQV